MDGAIDSIQLVHSLGCKMSTAGYITWVDTHRSTCYSLWAIGYGFVLLPAEVQVFQVRVQVVACVPMRVPMPNPRFCALIVSIQEHGGMRQISHKCKL